MYQPLSLFDMETENLDLDVDSGVVETVRSALAADGVLEDIDVDGLAVLAEKFGCPNDAILVALAAWSKVSSAVPGQCGMYALVEVLEMVLRGDLAAFSPRAHVIVRCFDLVGCEKSPALPRVTSTLVYGRRAVADLGGPKLGSDASSFAMAQALAVCVEPFIQVLTT